VPASKETILRVEANVHSRSLGRASMCHRSNARSR
jgi:hypothetical protein